MFISGRFLQQVRSCGLCFIGLAERFVGSWIDRRLSQAFASECHCCGKLSVPTIPGIQVSFHRRGFMNRFLCAGLLVLLGESAIWAQSAPFRVYTQPPVPSNGSLAKLDLVLGRHLVPMDGRHTRLKLPSLTAGGSSFRRARIFTPMGRHSVAAHLPNLYQTSAAIITPSLSLR